MLAASFQRRLADDKRRSKPWWLPMESIAGQSSLLRVSRRFALVGVIFSALLTGCAVVGLTVYAVNAVGAVVDVTSSWYDEDNLRTVSPEERDRARATVDDNERPEDSWCNSGLEDCEK